MVAMVRSAASAAGASAATAQGEIPRYGGLVSGGPNSSVLTADRESTSALHPVAPLEASNDATWPPSLARSGVIGVNAGGATEPRIQRQPGNAERPASLASR